MAPYNQNKNKMKILQLKSENFKKLKAVELTLDANQNVVLITGKNGQGKTSILDSIWAALGGGKALPQMPIREGEEKAEVVVDLGQYKITRSFTEKASYIKVENADGAKYSNPQELLNAIIGQLSFDPLEFARLDAKKQVAALVQVVGLDFSELDAKKKKLTEERVYVGREMKSAPAPTTEEHDEAIKFYELEPKSIKELSDRYSTAVTRTGVAGSLKNRNNEIDSLIAKLQKEREENTTHILEIEKNLEDPAALKAELDQAEEYNAKITWAKNVMGREQVYTAKENQYSALSNQIEDIEFEKQDLLAKAKMPIEGLSWTEEGVLYKGIPFEQLSGAEQLKVSMAIAMTANPKLRVILIRDGSLLDQANMQVIYGLAKDLDFQVWIEKVDDTGKVGIYIEEGEVKAINNN